MADTSRRSERNNKASVTHITLSALLDTLNNPEWDLLIVGDGSGTHWEGPCGWACTLVEQKSMRVWPFYGGANKGSIFFAEGMPYKQALTWYHETAGRKGLQVSGFKRVLIFTDNQPLAKTINNIHAEQLNLVNATWKAAVQEGYQLRAHWMPRETLAMNVLADLIAGNSRRFLVDHNEKIGTDLTSLQATLKELFSSMVHLHKDAAVDLAACEEDARHLYKE